MSAGLIESIFISAGAVLLTAILIVWRTSIAGQIRLLVVQGAALAGLVGLLAFGESSLELAALAGALFVVKGLVIPGLIWRAAGDDVAAASEVAARPALSLLAAAVMCALGFAVAQPIIALRPTAATQAVSVGFAVVLIGFLILVTRRRAVPQVIGFVLIDNGIAVVAFVTTTGVPLIVELGAALTVLFVVLILQVLTTRMRSKFGDTDLDELRKLAD